MKTQYYIFFLLCLAVSFTNAQDNHHFDLKSGERYIISAWVKQDVSAPVKTYNGCKLKVEFTLNTLNGGPYTPISGAPGEDLTFIASGAIIDGWQRIIGLFTVPTPPGYNTEPDNIAFKFESAVGATCYFDDVRICPYNGTMKSFVYDEGTQRLMAELDENNYATFYEYDAEGGLVRVKKETERGVYTIQETRSSTVKKENNN